MEDLRSEVAGIETHATAQGEGPVLLILHGWGSSSNSWTRIQGELAKDGFCVVCLDMPGFGETSPPSEAWGVDSYASFVLTFIDSMSVERIVLLGHSFGGQVAVKIAAEHPEIVEKLILVAPAVFRQETGLSQKTLSALAKAAGSLMYLFPIDKLRNNARSLLYMMLRRRDYLRAEGVMRDVFGRVVREDVSGLACKITAPTLLLWGEQDNLVPIEDAHALQKRIANSELRIIPSAGHSPQSTALEETISFIRTFLQ